MKPKCLNYGDTIGLIAPSYAITPERIAASVQTLRDLGFRVKYAKNLFSDAWGFAGTDVERAADFHEMIADPDVKMILFGGGEVGSEILPLIDWDLVRRNPKILCSYSDSTTLLNAVTSRTGLVTFYGASPRTFNNLTEYNRTSFERRVIYGDIAYEKNSAWQTICGGHASGILTGGYLVNYAVMLNGEYFKIDKRQKYILFIEDHEKFSSPPVLSKYFSHIAQSGWMENVTGLIFGHYSTQEYPQVDEILRRFGEKFGIPVVRCEDFGHGVNNAVLPLGVRANLDADACTFEFEESGVIL